MDDKQNEGRQKNSKIPGGGGYNQPLRLIDNCSFVKTLLMLIVVLYHSIAFWGGGWFTAFKPQETIVSVRCFARWLNSFHVYTFVLTSGYLYSFLIYEKGKYQKYGSFLKNKAKRLLVPYAFIAIVWVIPIGQVFFHNTTWDIIKGYLLGTGPSQLWFLLMLFGVFAIIWWLSDIVHNSLGAPILLAGGFDVVGYLGSHFIDNYFMIWTSCLYLPVFIFGMKLRDMHISGKFLVFKSALLVGLVLVDVVLFALQQYVGSKQGALYSIINIPIELVLHLLGAFTAFSVLQRLAVMIRWKDSKLFMLFSGISMIVYLLHQQLIYLSIAAFNGAINPYLNMLINFGVAIIGSFFIAKLLMSNKYTRFLVGEK